MIIWKLATNHIITGVIIQGHFLWIIQRGLRSFKCIIAMLRFIAKVKFVIICYIIIISLAYFYQIFCQQKKVSCYHVESWFKTCSFINITKTFKIVGVRPISCLYYFVCPVSCISVQYQKIYIVIITKKNYWRNIKHIWQCVLWLKNWVRNLCFVLIRNHGWKIHR